MIRKFAQRHRQDLVDDSANDWTHWAFIETLRRTIFLVQIINVISTRLQKQNPFFYEALDDDLVLDMPLPAAAPLWEANQEQQWLFVRSKQPRRHLTGRMVQQDYTSIPNDADTFTMMVIGSLVLDNLSGIPAL
ncbi:hypothetical protein BU25DRAFT_412287 [Macroventuria anomochaeta]|uniref:Uncharacterized protein n=1 Tax=Macroventuria anomochaeta TaxID=301207 RepID=A0ACB6RWE3_9PLEO|nr:uncharacterized protein BU25DRAFT_412287 [Macroventuria anomochaeta]KAF2626053.1 hypothetical protein BU25DRAFT_412287 [Macroventuria anomochaeta]